jgi:hypothetical protein
MALRAIWQVFKRDLCLNMACLDFIRLVIVTTITGEFHISAGVTGFTFYGSMPAVIQWEVMNSHASGSPDVLGVTILTLPSEESGMDSGFGMALHA